MILLCRNEKQLCRKLQAKKQTYPTFRRTVNILAAQERLYIWEGKNAKPTHTQPWTGTGSAKLWARLIVADPKQYEARCR